MQTVQQAVKHARGLEQWAKPSAGTIRITDRPLRRGPEAAFLFLGEYRIPPPGLSGGESAASRASALFNVQHALNNPLYYTDPSGHDAVACQGPDSTQAECAAASITEDDYLQSLDDRAYEALMWLLETAAGYDIARFLIDNRVSNTVGDVGSPSTSYDLDGDLLGITLGGQIDDGVTPIEHVITAFTENLAHEGWHVMHQDVGAANSLQEEYIAFSIEFKVYTEILNATDGRAYAANGTALGGPSGFGGPAPGTAEELYGWFQTYHPKYVTNPFSNEDPAVQRFSSYPLPAFPPTVPSMP